MLVVYDIYTLSLKYSLLTKYFYDVPNVLSAVILSSNGNPGKPLNDPDFSLDLLISLHVYFTCGAPYMKLLQLHI